MMKVLDIPATILTMIASSQHRRQMVRRAISAAVAVTYVIAGCVMIGRADYPWALVQFALASLATLMVAA